MPKIKSLFLASACAFFLSLPPAAAIEGEFTIAADEIIHMKEGNALIAQGNVEIGYQDYILKSDMIIYLMDEERIISSGVIEVHKSDGTVFHLTDATLTKDMHNMLARNIRILFSSGASFKAEAVKRSDNGPIRMKNASYTACKICQDEQGNDKAPIWRANANNITFNQEQHIISYKSAWFEVYDVPVFYTPFFYHPDPSIKRKSGLLAPSMTSNSDLGRSIEMPVYFVLSDYSDLKLTPKFNTKHDPILSSEYRHNFNSGSLLFQGMITDHDERGNRHYVNTMASFDINDYWRFKGQVERASDDTVLKYYNLEGRNRAWLTTDVSFARYSRDSNLTLKGLSFQDLRDDVDDARIPDIIPYASYTETFTNMPAGSYLTFSSNILSIERNDDRYNDTRRIATLTQWSKNYNSSFGAVFRITGAAIANVYSISNYEYKQGQTFSGTKGAFMPYLLNEVRYPFVRKDENSYQVIEPIIQFIAAPNSKPSDKIPNEDSKDFEFEDTSVLRENRFTGFDKYDVGSRLNYGLRWSAYGRKTGQISTFLGQSYRFTDSSEYPEKSGFDNSLSDYVGRVTAYPSENLSLNYRFRLDQRNLEFRHHELNLQTGPKSFNLSLDYLFLTKTTSDFSNFNDREEIYAKISSQLTRDYNASIYATRDLKENRYINIGANLTYEDECLTSGLFIERNFNYDRDFSEGFEVKFKVTLKSMGDGVNTFYNREKDNR